MNEYAIFEFTQSLFNERTFAVFVNNVLHGLAIKDDLLSDELIEHRIPVEEYIKADNYASDIQNSIEVGMQKDYNKIHSILNEAVLNNKKGSKEFITHVIKVAESLDSLSTKKVKHTYFKYISSSINNFKVTLKSDYLVKNNLLSKDVAKLKWNGGVGSLGTLFYELRNRQKTEDGKTFIEAPVSEIIEFLIASFTNENGDPLEKLSLQTYLYKQSKSVKKNLVKLDSVTAATSTKLKNK